MESISEMEAELNAYPWVEIAREGSFKFVMVKVILRSKQYKFKTLVSGCKTVESHSKYNGTFFLLRVFLAYKLSENIFFFLCRHTTQHADDLFKMVAHRIHRDGFNSEYLGGGYMEHIPTEKKINIYAGITGVNRGIKMKLKFKKKSSI